MTWWTFRIFFIFSARGRGRGSPRRLERGGGTIFYWKSQGGGSPGRVGAGGRRRAGRVFAGNWGGGGLNICFGGRNSHQDENVRLVLALAVQLADSLQIATQEPEPHGGGHEEMGGGCSSIEERSLQAAAWEAAGRTAAVLMHHAPAPVTAKGCLVANPPAHKVKKSRSRSRKNSGPFFHPQPPSLLFLLLEPGSERKVLTKETWFPLLRAWKSWKLQWEQLLPQPGSP